MKGQLYPIYEERQQDRSQVADEMLVPQIMGYAELTVLQFDNDEDQNKVAVEKKAIDMTDKDVKHEKKNLPDDKIKEVIVKKCVKKINQPKKEKSKGIEKEKNNLKMTIAIDENDEREYVCITITPEDDNDQQNKEHTSSTEELEKEAEKLVVINQILQEMIGRIDQENQVFKDGRLMQKIKQKQDEMKWNLIDIMETLLESGEFMAGDEDEENGDEQLMVPDKKEVKENDLELDIPLVDPSGCDRVSSDSVGLPKVLEDLIYWRDSKATAAHVILCTLFLSSLGSHTMVKVISIISFFAMVEGFIYMGLRRVIRFRPFEKVMQVPIEVPVEPLMGLVRTLISNLNRCVSTIQFILFNDSILMAIVTCLCLIEIRNFTQSYDGLTLFTYAFLGIFLVPRIIFELKNRAKKFWQKVQATRNKNLSFVGLLILLVKFFENALFPTSGEKVLVYVNKGQQTDDYSDDETEPSPIQERKHIVEVIKLFLKKRQAIEIVENRKSRPRIYSLWYLIDVLMCIELPKGLHDLIYWRRTMVTATYLTLGLFFLNLMLSHSFIEIFSLLMLIELGHMMLYMVLRRVMQFQPYEKLLKLQVNISPERTVKITRMVVNWLNRWLATFQYIFFGGNLFVASGVLMVLVEMRNLGIAVNGLTIVTHIYLGIFLLPSIVSQLKKYLKEAWEDTQYGGYCSNSFMHLIIMFVDLFEYVPAFTFMVDRGQQTTEEYIDNEDPQNVVEQDLQELQSFQESFDRFGTSVRKRGNCGRNAAICIYRDMQTLGEKGTPST